MSEYQNYLNERYTACGMDDYWSDRANQIKAENYYDIGLKLFEMGDTEEAVKYYNKALSVSIYTEDDLPYYEEEPKAEDFI